MEDKKNTQVSRCKIAQYAEEEENTGFLWTSVADPHYIDADPDADQDPACHFDADADLDPACHFDTYPDPTFHLDLVPNPDPSFQIEAWNLESAQICPFSIHFGLLSANYDFDADADPNPAYHFDADADPDSIFQFDADLCRSGSTILLWTSHFKGVAGPWRPIMGYSY
jgi:hypothetical protein